jgi:hypothetical protein
MLAEFLRFYRRQSRPSAVDTDDTDDVFLRVRDFSGSTLALVAMVDPSPYRRYQRNQRRFLNVCVPHTLGSCGCVIQFIPSLTFEDFALRRPPLPCKHTKRAGVHSFSGGGGYPPSLTFLAVWGGGGVSPTRLDCTRARFVCMYFVRIGEYFEGFWQVFSEIVLQIPQETASFAERILRKEREWSDLSSLAPRYRSLAGSLSGRARVQRRA